MEINVTNLESECNKLNSELEIFYNNYLNIYNELNNANSYWQDYHSRLFFSNANSEKNKVNNTYNEINELKNIYKYLIDEYKSIGRKIKVNLDGKDEIISKFNNFHDKINELISIYNSLDLAFCPSIANKLNNQKDRIVKIKEEMLSSKNKIKKILEKIESIEDEINVRVSKMNLEEIKEVDIKEFM